MAEAIVFLASAEDLEWIFQEPVAIDGPVLVVFWLDGVVEISDDLRN
jgi:hypothetical protein